MDQDDEPKLRAWDATSDLPATWGWEGDGRDLVRHDVVPVGDVGRERGGGASSRRPSTVRAVPAGRRHCAFAHWGAENQAPRSPPSGAAQRSPEPYQVAEKDGSRIFAAYGVTGQAVASAPGAAPYAVIWWTALAGHMRPNAISAAATVWNRVMRGFTASVLGVFPIHDAASRLVQGPFHRNGFVNAAVSCVAVEETMPPRPHTRAAGPAMPGQPPGPDRRPCRRSSSRWGWARRVGCRPGG